MSKRDLLESIANSAIERIDNQIADLARRRDAATEEMEGSALDSQIATLWEDRHIWERVLELSYLA